MNIDEYQVEAHTTAFYNKSITTFLANAAQSEVAFILELNYAACKLNGEAGEVAEIVGKIVRDHRGYLTDDYAFALVKELGDVLWYISEICTILGINISEVAQRNLWKLAKRAEEGKLSGDGSNR